MPARRIRKQNGTMTETSAPARPGLWRNMPRELAYLLVKFPLAVAGFTLAWVLFWTGIGLIPLLLIGLVILVGALYVARGYGSVDRTLLGWATRREIARPDWRDREAGSGFTGWIRAVLGNGHYWLYLLHVMLVDFVVVLVTWIITVVWLSLALAGLSFGLRAFLPGTTEFYPFNWLLSHYGLMATNPVIAEIVAQALFGLVFALTLPLITRGLTSLHWAIGNGMLGSFRATALQREVHTLEESRGAAHSAEGHSLRRLERDIHDGPQQRLVRLQMDLAAAERQLEEDPDAARALLTGARQQSKEALEELRALSRGFAPPILLDRGLVAALQSQAVRATVPTTVIDELPAGTVLPQELERNAYFVASEALTNAAKHAQATAVQVRVSLPAAEDGSRALEITVHDDGVGGARPAHGHGLAGLADRVRGLGGSLEVISPEGGPTEVIARMPVRA